MSKKITIGLLFLISLNLADYFEINKLEKELSVCFFKSCLEMLK